MYIYITLFNVDLLLYSVSPCTLICYNHEGVKEIIEFWQANPQFAEVRNTLPAGEVYYNDPDQLMIGNNGLSFTD